MTILIVSFVVCAVIAAVIIGYADSKSKKRKAKKEAGQEKSDVIINFILALVATFAGVFLAFNLSNIQVEKSERDNLGSLLGQSIDELNIEVTILEGLPEFIRDREEEDSIKMLNNNPIEDVVSVEFLISNQLFPKYCTQMGAMTMLRLVRDKEKLREAINNQDLEFENRLDYIDIYREYIEDLRDLLLLERDYVGGKISSKEVAEGLNELHYVDTHEVTSK